MTNSSASAGALPSTTPTPPPTRPCEVQILEAEGGRANVAAAELDDWIASLWYGRRLSYTFAVTVALAALCAGIARLSAGAQ